MKKTKTNEPVVQCFTSSNTGDSSERTARQQHAREKLLRSLRVLTEALDGWVVDSFGLTAGEAERLGSLTGGLLDLVGECEGRLPPARSEAEGGPGELGAHVEQALANLIAGFRRVATERDRLRTALESIEVSLAHRGAAPLEVVTDQIYRSTVVALDPPLPRSEWPVEEFDASRHERPPRQELSVVLDPAEVAAVAQLPARCVHGCRNIEDPDCDFHGCACEGACLNCHDPAGVRVVVARGGAA